MFSSKRAEDMGCTCYLTDEKYWTTHYGAVEPGSMMEPNYECFEHFPHPQHNAPNPILVDVRAHIGRTSWSNMLHAFTYATENAGHFVTKDWEQITDPDQIDHAGRVLERLARLAEVQ